MLGHHARHIANSLNTKQSNGSSFSRKMQVQNLQLAFSLECIALTSSHSHETTGPVSVYIAREVTRTKKKLMGKRLEEVCSIPNNCTLYYIAGLCGCVAFEIIWGLYNFPSYKKTLDQSSKKKSSIKEILNEKQINAHSIASFSLGAFHVGDLFLVLLTEKHFGRYPRRIRQR